VAARRETTVSSGPSETRQEAEDVIQDLVESFRKKEVWVFAGAGISVHSGIPAVSQLLPAILSGLDVSAEDVAAFMNSRFAFEEVMQTLLACGRPEDAGALLRVFSGGRRNTNHILLAKLMKDGRLGAVVTTNFDRLLEDALWGQRVRRGRGYQLLYRDEDLEQIDWEDAVPRVIKIHGSAEDPGNMAVTLERVAKRELSTRRREVIERTFSSGRHRTVLVLGYSSSDAFDISPHIAALQGELKRVVYLEHVEGKGGPRAERLDSKMEKNPFRRFRDGVRIYYNTDALVRRLWGDLLPGVLFRFRQGTTSWRKNVEEWCASTYLDNAGAACHEIAGRLFCGVSQFRTGRKRLDRAIARYSLLDSEKQVLVMGLAGDASVRLREMEEAVHQYYGPAMQEAKDAGCENALMHVFSSAADMFDDNGEPEKAGTYYMQALSAAAKRGDEKEAALQMAKWANTCNHRGAFPAARLMLTKALEKAEKAGDIRTKALALGYLGDAYAGLSQHAEAIGCYERAVEAARHLGDKHNEGIHLGGLADAYIGLGRYERAIECLLEALPIAEVTGDDPGRAVLLTMLGSVHRASGAYREAVAEYKEALRLLTREVEEKEPMMMAKVRADAETGMGACYWKLGEVRAAIDALESGEALLSVTGDKQVYGDMLQLLGMAYREEKAHDRAAKRFRQALEIYREREDADKEIETAILLGSALHAAGERRQAIGVYKEALKKARRKADQAKEGALLINMGKAHFDLGEYETAADLFERALAVCSRARGGDHPNTKIAAGNLAAAKKRLDAAP
jgi:tetratricopeptide (TPR) repeat protein